MNLILRTLCLAIMVGTSAFAGDLSDPTEPWTTANAGVTSQVPPPFEPLVVDGDEVSMQRVCVDGPVFEARKVFPDA